jgi:hypothetical protein
MHVTVKIVLNDIRMLYQNYSCVLLLILNLIVCELIDKNVQKNK